MNEDITNYPLSWPFGWERTDRYQRGEARFDHHSILKCVRALETELRRMGGTNMIVSTNIKVRNDGIPYSNQRVPDDAGVAVYFDWKNKPIVFACDKWDRVEDNLWAIVKHIEALRGQERWGVGSLDQAFAGYAALPDPDTRSWWDVLGVAQTATNDEIKKAYLNLAKIHHPDAGGDPLMFDQITKAYQLATGKAQGSS